MNEPKKFEALDSEGWERIRRITGSPGAYLFCSVARAGEDSKEFFAQLRIEAEEQGAELVRKGAYYFIEWR